MLPPLPPPPRTGFVSVLAKITLILAGISVAWSLLQSVGALLLPDSVVAAAGDADWPLPQGLLWALEHRVALSLALLLLSLLSLATAWGLLKRQEWARLVFIALLLLSAAGNLFSLLLVSQLFDAIIAMYPKEFLSTTDGQEFMAQMQASHLMWMGTSVAGVLAMGALHVWIAWKLCTAAVRAEFRPPAV